MSPWHPCGGAGVGDDPGQDRIAVEAFVPVEFAGVDIGFPRVTRRVDQEFRAILKQGGTQYLPIGVVEFGPTKIAKRNALPAQQRLISVTDITGASEKIDHGCLFRKNPNEADGHGGEQGYFRRRALRRPRRRP